MKLNLSHLCICFCVLLASCKKKIEPSPEILCGSEFSQSCLYENWIITKGAEASYKVLDNYEGRNALLFVNPHEPTQYNPPSVRLESFIKNVKPNKVYQISCDVKIKGYGDYTSNSPSFLFYAYANDNWYGELYFGSQAGVFLYNDWTTMKYNFTSDSEPVLNFELATVYDSTWISNLVIREL